MSDLSRRELAWLLAAGGVTAAGFATTEGAQAQARQGWEEGPMRWAHLTFTDDDPPRYDPNAWADFFRRAHIEGAVLTAGGVSAFYPTTVPFHTRAEDLGARDMFGDMLRACRENGMRVMARLDVHALWPDAMRAHPDWAMRTPDGRVRPASDPRLVLTCMNGGVAYDFLPSIMNELSTRYRVDGFFGNRWGGNGVCFCDVCRGKFRAATGFEIPTKVDGHPGEDPTLAAYLRWEEAIRIDRLKTWNAVARRANPDAFYVPGTLQDMPPSALRAVTPAAFADRQGRQRGAPIYVNGWSAKETRALLGDRPTIGIFAVMQSATPYRYMASTVNQAELRTYIHDGIAQGFRPSMYHSKGEILDRRWMATVEEVYAWHFRHEAYFRNTASLARVGLVQSAQTGAYYDVGEHAFVPPRNEIAGYAGALNGWYRTLVESRTLFEIVDDRDMAKASLDRYRVLILPNVACLSYAQCDQIRDFVRGGGRIIATGETSLFDEQGRRRANFGLADLFGCNFAGKVETGVKNSYLTVRHGHPLVRGLEAAPRVINGTMIVHVRASPEVNSPLTLIPSYPDLPMERVFPRVRETKTAMVFARAFGSGRVVYFPTDLDRTYGELSNEDHFALLANAVAWASDESPPMTVSGPGLLDLSLFRQKSSLAAHLVNLTNPMSMSGLLRETLPVGPLAVDLKLPPGAKPSRVRLLERELDAEWAIREGRLTVKVPRVDIHEVVAIDLA